MLVVGAFQHVLVDCVSCVLLLFQCEMTSRLASPSPPPPPPRQTNSLSKYSISLDPHHLTRTLENGSVHWITATVRAASDSRVDILILFTSVDLELEAVLHHVTSLWQIYPTDFH